jgi:hypothetical protein
VIWTSCYQTINEADARLVGELLERGGIPCRVQPVAMSVLPSFGFEVVVSEDRRTEALALVDGTEMGVANVKPSWRCAHCGEDVDGELAACWSCGGGRDDRSSEPRERYPDPVDAVEGPPKLAVFRTFWNAIRLVAAHPTILASAIPLLLWEGISFALELPRLEKSQPLTLQQLIADLPPCLIMEPLTAGAAIAFAGLACREPPSWTRAAPHLVPRIPTLFMLAALLTALQTAVGLASMGVDRGSMRQLVLAPLVLALGYLNLRLVLSEVAIVLEGMGVRGAIRRSWALTASNWLRIFGLMVLVGVVPGVCSLVLPPALHPVLRLVSPVFAAALVLAHRDLTAAPSSSPSPAGPLQPLSLQPA